MSKHGDTERFIVDLFKKAGEFTFEKSDYGILEIGKPRPNKGECKTDVYILVFDLRSCLTREIKISIKQNNADFLENKMSMERATELFGDDTKEILTISIKSVEKSFYNDFLVCFSGYGNTEAKSIKIGWKFEFINKHGGGKSGEILLTDDQKIDVYSGSNLNNDKKDAKVNGTKINDSGIANYILEVPDTKQSLDYYLNNLIPIEEFAIRQKIYFVCKAINYRSQCDKWDSNRPLSVFINWRIVDGVLKAELVFDKPLEKKANEIGDNIRNILNALKINSNNFEELNKYLDKSIVSLH